MDTIRRARPRRLGIQRATSGRSIRLKGVLSCLQHNNKRNASALCPWHR